MPQNQLGHYRRSIRLAGYDYSTPGAYAITVVTQQRRCLYGEVAGGAMRLNAAGQMIEKWWRELAHKFPAVEIDIYGVMPNHFHGIIVIKESAVTKEGAHIGAPLQDGETVVTGEGAHTGAPLHDDEAIAGVSRHWRAPLPEMMQWFKTMTTNEYIHCARALGWPRFPGKLWQRGYYEHVIRGPLEMDSARLYIVRNPAQWALDRENPDHARLA